MATAVSVPRNLHEISGHLAYRLSGLYQIQRMLPFFVMVKVCHPGRES